jgi:ABC-type Zn uptake system ZnuABC Zn-binding protein ZnuA
VRRSIATGLALVAAVTVTGCRSDSGRPAVVATTTQVADMTRAIAGNDIAVEQILHPNADPHEYEPRPSDAQAVASAKLVIRSGGDVDDWLNGVVQQAGGKAKVITLIDDVHRRGSDAHWWQDPRNAIAAAGAIGDGLAQADPKHAGAYRSRAKSYENKLRRLDTAIARCVAKLPPTQRKLVTSHDALGYYARRYGFQVIGAAIPSLSTQAQPSGKETQRLVGQIKREHVAATFPESSLNPKLEQAIARDAHAKVGGSLWADSLGPKGSSGATYIGSLGANTRTIVSALSGGRIDCASLPR